MCPAADVEQQYVGGAGAACIVKDSGIWLTSQPERESGHSSWEAHGAALILLLPETKVADLAGGERVGLLLCALTSAGAVPRFDC